MDHYTHWFRFLPGYQNILDYLNHNAKGMVIPLGASTDYSTLHHVYAALLVFITLIIMALVARRRLSDLESAIVPDRQLSAFLIFEMLISIAMGLMESIIGKDYKRYVPMIGTLTLFILFSNLLGLLPGFVPPTDNLNTTLALGLVVFVWFNFHGLRAHGFGHISHLLNPVGEPWGWVLAPFLGPIEIFGLLLRPATLALRLAANMIGDHAVLFAFAGIIPLLIPLPFYALGLLVCMIQTAVFCILSTVYVSLHTAEVEHH